MTKTLPQLTEQERNALLVVRTVADAIKELGSVPSGHLYARLMGVMNLDQYQAIINVLIKAKMVKVQNHLITWIG